MRLARHHGGEIGFGPPDVFADGQGHVVGRANGGGAHGVVQGDGLTRRQAQFRGRLGRGAGRDGQYVVQMRLALRKGFERQIERHHLGQRRRESAAVGMTRKQDFAGGGVHHDGGVAAVFLRLGLDRPDVRPQGDQGEGEEGEKAAAEQGNHGRLRPLGEQGATGPPAAATEPYHRKRGFHGG